MSQLVAVSDAAPGIVHGVAVLQNRTFVTGSALAGANCGTASGPLAVGDALGVACGEPDALALGDVVATVPPGRPARDRTTTPTMPRMMTMPTAIAAGTSHAGRSKPGPPPPR